MTSNTENNASEPKGEGESPNPRRFIIKKAGETVTENRPKNKSLTTLYTLDWTLGFYERNSQEYIILRDLTLPDITKIKFDREHFLNLLAFSFSLDIKEKERVLRSFSDTGLSEFQIRELRNTFEEEQKEFDKLIAKESQEICQLYFRSLDSWARLLWGKFQGRQKLCFLLQDLVSADSKISSQLKRDGHFWKIASDYAVSWGAPLDVLEKLIEKGQISTDGEIPFSLELIDYLYKTNVDLLEDRLSYIRQRVVAAQVFLEEVKPTKKTSIVIARAWAMGICQDWLSLNEEAPAIHAITQAESAIELHTEELPEDEEKRNELLEKFNDSKISILSWKINTQSVYNEPASKVIDTLKSLHAIQKDGSINEFAIDSLYYRLQFPIASKYLSKRLNQLTKDDSNLERLYSFEAADAAIELLIISTISNNSEFRLESTLFLIGFCQFRILKSPPSPHEAQKFRCIYRAIHVLDWVGFVELEEDRACIEELILEINTIIKNSEIEFHPSFSDKSDPKHLAKIRKLSPVYIAILCIDGVLSNNEGMSNIWSHAIVDRRILLQVIIVLFSLSFKEEIRIHAQSIAHKLLAEAGGGLFGPELKTPLEMFGKFGSRLSFCGDKNPFDHTLYYWELDFLK